jgi:leader peptidase (prepilin peptidase)/N-methyltransferase
MDFIISLFFIMVLVAVAIIDFRRSLIPNKIVYPAVIITAAIDIFSPGRGISPAVITGIALAGLLAIAGMLQKRMGMGDIKLAFLIGLMTGLPSGFVALALGIFLGGIAAIVLLLLKLKRRNDEMPYGPYLACGAVIVILFNGAINAYIRALISTRL